MISVCFFCSNTLHKNYILSLDFNIEYGCQHLSESVKNYLSNNIYQESIKAIRKRNFNCIVIAYLTINSIKSRFELLVSQIVGEVGVLVISETMLEDSFILGRSNFQLF